MEAKLYKIPKEGLLTGVCAGIADYYKIDPTIVRISTAALCIFWNFMVLVYIILAVVLPEKSMVKTNEQSNEIPTYEEEQTKDRSDFETKPKTKNTRNTLLAIGLICGGIGLFVTRFIFHYAIGLDDFITLVLLGVGIYLLVSGLTENKESSSERSFKIILGIILSTVSLLLLFHIFHFIIFSVFDIFASIRYLWPLFIVAIGLNLLLPTKKTTAWIWIILGLVIIAYTIASNIL